MRRRLEGVRELLDGDEKNVLVEQDDELVSDILGEVGPEEHVLALLIGHQYTREDLEDELGTDNLYTIEVSDDVRNRGWESEKRAYLRNPGDLTGLGMYSVDKIDQLYKEHGSLDDFYVILSDTQTMKLESEEGTPFRWIHSFAGRPKQMGFHVFYLDAGLDEGYTNELLQVMDAHVTVDEDGEYSMRSRSPR